MVITIRRVEPDHYHVLCCVCALIVTDLTRPHGIYHVSVFKKDGGSTTAGNASQVSDGAAAVLAMR